MYQLKSSLEVAVEAAARVDAVLAKKGKIKPNPILVSANKAPTDLFQTEFEINDVPVTARNLLTKGITQEEINHFSGASISTRGRFVNPEDKDKLPKGERPLYLFIQGPNKQSLDLAIQRIDSLIKEVMEQEKFKMGPPPPVITMQTSLPGLEKVIVGLDNAPATFDVRGKVLGPGGANLQYISNETGAVVTLRGRTSGYPEPGTGQESPEPLHICVEHQKMEVLQAARQLAFNLVETIQQEFSQLHPQLPVPGGPPLQLPPQGPGAVALSPDQLPPGMVQLPIPGQVGGLVSVPPPSLAVPPPHLVQQPPPLQSVNLPPPGVHIPSHQGPLAQGVTQQQIVQQPPPMSSNVGLPPHSQTLQQVLSQPPPTITSQAQLGHMVLAGQPPPTSVVTSSHQQSQPQAFITQATYPIQYIQAGGQTLMTVREGAGGSQVLIPQQQQQLIQTTAGLIPAGQQQAQLQLIPGPNGTQQLVMQQPQQVTMLLQYQQPGEAGKAGVGRLITPQRLATPVQIQLQPGLQLINSQLQLVM